MDSRTLQGALRLAVSCLYASEMLAILIVSEGVLC